MKFITLLLLSLLSQVSIAQTKADTIQLIRNSMKLLDLDFTDAEADSMIGNINCHMQFYKAMHKVLPTNDIPYPFAFNPLPFREKVPTNQQKVGWDIPKNVQMPANKNDLAFYSLLQLASLIKNKKIS